MWQMSLSTARPVREGGTPLYVRPPNVLDVFLWKFFIALKKYSYYRHRAGGGAEGGGGGALVSPTPLLRNIFQNALFIKSACSSSQWKNNSNKYQIE